LGTLQFEWMNELSTIPATAEVMVPARRRRSNTFPAGGAAFKSVRREQLHS
jgi:hypothetical protein